ncbi:MAG: GTP-binding protein [Clostridia bacterium]|nr:GTP-binding protein [Clostridia bacterium]
MTNVTIISGFLGAGKTTLIQKLLKEAYTNEKCVLLENEYGEVGIDGGFMKDSGIEITELNSGCICCTLAGDFADAIGEIVEKFHPDRLIIEPSGVGKLSDIRRVVEEHEEKTGEIHLTGCATVVDAAKCRMYMKNFGEFFTDQVKCAETVIFSRSQNVSGEKLEAAAALIKNENGEARLITTPWSDITGSVIADTIEHPAALIDVNELFPEHHHHHHHHHDHEHEHHDHEHEHHDHDHEHHDHEHEHHDHEHEHHEHDHEHHDHDHEHHDHNHEHECGCGHHHEHHHHEHHYDEHGNCSCGHHHHDADEVFENIGLETARKFDREKLTEALKAIDEDESLGTILRMKGILPAADGSWIHFDYVPGEINVRSGSADYTGRLCIIGVALDKEKITNLLGM